MCDNQVELQLMITSSTLCLSVTPRYIGNSALREDILRTSQRKPTNNISLEAQQRALIAAQEDMLRCIGRSENGNHIDTPFLS